MLNSDVSMAPLARCGCRRTVRVVWSVAIGALLVVRLLWCKGGLLIMAADAGRPPRGDEVVRLVTAFTRRVAQR